MHHNYTSVFIIKRNKVFFSHFGTLTIKENILLSPFSSKIKTKQRLWVTLFPKREEGTFLIFLQFRKGVRKSKLKTMFYSYFYNRLSFLKGVFC